MILVLTIGYTVCAKHASSVGGAQEKRSNVDILLRISNFDNDTC
jgi:hypothetical protein